MVNNPSHIFRMSYYKNINVFAKDRYIYAPNRKQQPQYSISYQDINSRRSADYVIKEFNPHDMVAFYFAPITRMQYALYHNGDSNEVFCKTPTGKEFKCERDHEIIFFIVEINKILKIIEQNNSKYYFSNQAINKVGYQVFEDWFVDKDNIKWQYFNDTPLKAKIYEIGYQGVCRYTHEPDKYPNRGAIRMAEFLIKDKFELKDFCAIVVYNDTIEAYVSKVLKKYGYSIPIHIKSDCYF